MKSIKEINFITFLKQNILGNSKKKEKITRQCLESWSWWISQYFLYLLVSRRDMFGTLRSSWVSKEVELFCLFFHNKDWNLLYRLTLFQLGSGVTLPTGVGLLVPGSVISVIKPLKDYWVPKTCSHINILIFSNP